jgi:hypothetical protein
MLIHHLKDAFFPALKQYMTCFAIYPQKARTKSKDIGGSHRLTGGCVCQRVNKHSCVRQYSYSCISPDFLQVLKTILIVHITSEPNV